MEWIFNDKTFFFVGLLLVIVGLSGSLLYAAETPKAPKYTWTKVCKGVYEVWNLNEVFLVENPETYNVNMLARSGEHFKNWEEAKANRVRLGLRSSSVKYLTPAGEVKEANERIFYTTIKYDDGKVLSVKGIRDQDKVRIDKEENSQTPFIIRSKYSNYHYFVDDEGVWGIQLNVTDKIRFEVTKLTKDTVNGKTLTEIRAGLTEEDIVYWNNNPILSPDDKYMAYYSNKRLQGFELWLLDLKKGTDQPLFGIPGKDLRVLTWTDDHTILYSLDKQYYVYDLNSQTSKDFLKDIKLLGYQSDLDLYVYRKNTDANQLYIYRKNANQEIKLPRLPAGVMVSNILSGSDYVPAPDGSKLLVTAVVRDPNRREVIYLLDSKTNFCGEIQCPQDERPSFIHGWVNNKTVIIRTKPILTEGTTTWVLTF